MEWQLWRALQSFPGRRLYARFPPNCPVHGRSLQCSVTGAELLFEIFSQRYERGSTIVTSNLPFDEWTSVFGSPNIAGRHHF